MLDIKNDFMFERQLNQVILIVFSLILYDQGLRVKVVSKFINWVEKQIIMRRNYIWIFIILFSFLTTQAQEAAEPAGISKITQSQIPGEAERLLPSSVPVEVTQALEKIVTSGGQQFGQFRNNGRRSWKFCAVALRNQEPR